MFHATNSCNSKDVIVLVIVIVGLILYKSISSLLVKEKVTFLIFITDLYYRDYSNYTYVVMKLNIKAQ